MTATPINHFLESQDFYELMQTYRHTPLDAAKEFEAVKATLRAALTEAQPVQPANNDDVLRCDIAARPLSYPLKDYHCAISSGPLNFTWQDKPHRLVYDLIAAVKWYAIAQPVPTAAAARTVEQHAKRYRWLRSTTNWVSSKGDRIDVRNNPDLWDKAIDAAIASKAVKL